MRLIIFFDLPMTTKSEIKVYNRFRKTLIREGYIMMQFSVYCKLFANREAAVKHVDFLKRNVPSDGQVRVMMITEKQYSKIALLTGKLSNQEAVANADSFIKL